MHLSRVSSGVPGTREREGRHGRLDERAVGAALLLLRELVGAAREAVGEEHRERAPDGREAPQPRRQVLPREQVAQLVRKRDAVVAQQVVRVRAVLVTQERKDALDLVRRPRRHAHVQRLAERRALCVLRNTWKHSRLVTVSSSKAPLCVRECVNVEVVNK